MDRSWMAILLFLCACSGGESGPVTQAERTLSTAEKAEQRTLLESFTERPQAEVIGQTPVQHPRVFELADSIQEWPDGRRGYRYLLRSATEEENGKITTVLILTDGAGDPPSKESAAAAEKILEVQVAIPVS